MNHPAGNIHLRTATKADAPFILWLEEVCMKVFATALWGTWRASTSLEALDPSNHQIIEIKGAPVGCLAVKVQTDALQVNRLYLAPTHQNRGIGAAVLRSTIALADGLGLPVKLRVLTTNPALKFYLREGFSVVHETAERRVLERSATAPA